MNRKNSESLFTFGSYIRKLRIEKDIGQRELAKKIDIAPSYLNDIEKNKRAAPKNIIIKKISYILKADLNLLNDLAGNSKKSQMCKGFMRTFKKIQEFVGFPDTFLVLGWEGSEFPKPNCIPNEEPLNTLKLF